MTEVTAGDVHLAERLAPALPAALLVALLVAAVTAPSTDAAGFLFVAVGLWTIGNLSATRPQLAFVLLVAFSLRVVVALLGHYAIELPDSRSDASNFETWAWIWGQGGLSHALSNFTSGSRFFAWTLSLVYVAFGHAPLAALMVNVGLGTATVWNVYQISRAFRGPRASLRNAALAAVFPTLILYSAILLREAAFHFLFTLMLLLFVRWSSDRSQWRALGLLAVVGVLAGMIHTLGAFAMMVLLTAATFLSLRDAWTRADVRVTAVVSIAAIVVVVTAILVTGIGLGKLDGMRPNIQWIELVQSKATRGRTAFPESLIVHSWHEFVWKGPARLAYLLFAPFPWLVERPLDMAGLLDASLYVALAVAFLAYRTSLPRPASAIALYLCVAILLLVLSVGVSNYGTGLRHRAKIVAPLLAVLPAERLPALGHRALSRANYVWGQLGLGRRLRPTSTLTDAE